MVPFARLRSPLSVVVVLLLLAGAACSSEADGSEAVTTAERLEGVSLTGDRAALEALFLALPEDAGGLRRTEVIVEPSQELPTLNSLAATYRREDGREVFVTAVLDDRASLAAADRDDAGFEKAFDRFAERLLEGEGAVHVQADGPDLYVAEIDGNDGERDYAVALWGGPASGWFFFVGGTDDADRAALVDAFARASRQVVP
jgi:hypothetical protein